MKVILKTIQDQEKVPDTVNVIQSAIIVPAPNIKSSDGAIIPKEAVNWTELQPAITIKKEEDSVFFTYILISIVLVVTFIAIRFLLKRRETLSK